jgi:hypothetical protein
MYILKKLLNLLEIYMKASQLHDLWDSPDNSRLTTKQFSFRLPVHIAAKIAALCEMYPQKNRTHIVADLLTSALDELEKNMPESLGNPIDESIQHDIDENAAIEGGKSENYYHLAGVRARFRNAANRHYSELEKELGNENPTPLFQELWVTKSDFENIKKWPPPLRP